VWPVSASTRLEERAVLQRRDLADHAAHGQADEMRARDLKFFQ